MPVDLYMVCGASPGAELSGCCRDHLSCQVQNSYYLTLHRKSVPSLNIRHLPVKCFILYYTHMVQNPLNMKR